MRAKLILVVLLALALVASACGSSDTETASGGDESATTQATETDASDTDGGDADSGDTDPATTEAMEDENPLGALRVPQDFGTIQEAVDAAADGDLVLIDAGVYNEAVVIETDNIVIRGVDRNETILDGEFDETLPNGINVFSNGVAVENLTVRNYVNNGVFFTGSYDDDFILTGYRASYITAHNNGDYGVYSFNATEGLFEHIYGSGHPDSAIYVGQCQPCNAIVTNVIGENNALGYSGTNAGGNLWIVNNEFSNNRVGMVPNTLSSEELAPQRGGVFAGNYAHDNGNEATPRKGGDWDLAFGVGIVIAGGNDNLVAKNLVTDNTNGGIAVSFFPSGDDLFTAGMNEVVDNVLSGNGLDLVLLADEALGNCFANNTFETSAPIDIETVAGCGLPTAEHVDVYSIPDPEGLGTIDYKDVPPPTEPQPVMPDALSTPASPALNMMPTMTIDDVVVPEMS